MQSQVIYCGDAEYIEAKRFRQHTINYAVHLTCVERKAFHHIHRNSLAKQTLCLQALFARRLQLLLMLLMYAEKCRTSGCL